MSDVKNVIAIYPLKKALQKSEVMAEVMGGATEDKPLAQIRGLYPSLAQRYYLEARGVIGAHSAQG